MRADAEPEKFISTTELAEHLGVSARVLEAWRIRGCSPPFYKVGRRVRYELSEVRLWLSQRRHQSTEEVKP